MWKLIFLLLPFFLLGQAPMALSLPEAVKKAIESSHGLSALAAAESAGQARIEQARAGFLPKVDYQESFTRSDNPVFVFSSLLLQRRFGAANFDLAALNRPDFRNNFQSQLSAEQILYDRGQTKRAIASAKLALDMNRAESRRAKMQLTALVAKAYFDVQLALAQLRVNDAAIQAAEADLASAKARREAGGATEADVLSVEVHLASIREEKAIREAEREVAMATLVESTGLDRGMIGPLSTTLRPLPVLPTDLGGTEAEASARRAELSLARSARQMAERGLEEAQARYLPQAFVRVGFEANRQYPFHNGGSNWLLTTGLRWNLWNGGADRARISEAQANLRRSQAEERESSSKVRLEVQSAWAELKATPAGIELGQKATAAAEEAQRISKDRYEAGLTSITELLRAETALVSTRSRLEAAIYRQRISAIRLALAASTLDIDAEVLQ